MLNTPERIAMLYRGNARERVFRSDRDRERFLECVERAVERRRPEVGYQKSAGGRGVYK